MRVTELFKVPLIKFMSDYESPIDGSVAYTTGTTLTCSGFPFTIADTSCRVLGLRVTNAAGKRKYYFDDQGSQIKLSATANVITISGDGLLKSTPFAGTDTEYIIWIKAQKKGYDLGTNLYRIKEQSPLNLGVASDPIINTTNVAAGTNYYPSSEGLDMLGYKGIAFHGSLVDCLLTVEVTSDLTPVTPDWDDITQSLWDRMTNSIGNVGFGGAGVTQRFYIDEAQLNCNYLRLKIVTYDATNTEKVHARRIY
jgi:hypothetical protein